MNHARQAAEQIDALQVSQDASIAMDQSEFIIQQAIAAATRERDGEIQQMRGLAMALRHLVRTQSDLLSNPSVADILDQLTGDKELSTS